MKGMAQKAQNPGDLVHRGALVTEETGTSPGQHAVGGPDDVLEAAHAQHGVDLRQLLQDGVLVALGETAGNDDAAETPGLFQLRHLQDVVDGLALGRVDEAAGVDDHEIGPVRIGQQGIAGLAHQV